LARAFGLWLETADPVDTVRGDQHATEILANAAAARKAIRSCRDSYGSDRRVDFGVGWGGGHFTVGSAGSCDRRRICWIRGWTN